MPKDGISLVVENEFQFECSVLKQRAFLVHFMKCVIPFWCRTP